MSVTVERLSSDQFYVQREPVFVDTFNLLPVYDKLSFRSDIALVGPKGIAKSLSFAYYAAKKKYPMVTFDCSEDVRRHHLIGSFILRGNETPFVLGPLPLAFEIANEEGQCILCLEELNALSPAVQKIINPLTDFRRRIEVPECKRIFELKKGAKLWVVAPMNTAVYSGVYQLNEDLKSRFRVIPLTYPTEENLIIDETFRKRPGAEVPDQTTINHIMTIAVETRQKSLEYALSTRDVIQILEDSTAIGIKDALWLASGKFEEGDRRVFQDMVWRTCNLSLPGHTPPAQSKSAQ